MKTVMILPDKRRAAWGFRYLLFQLLVLPLLLSWLNSILGYPLDEGRLNMLYYTVNFAVLAGIFWHYLSASLRGAAQNIGPVLLAAMLFFLADRFLTTVVDTVIWRMDPDFFNVNDANISLMVRENLPMWVFATVVLVPPAEELLFRGVLFGGLYPKSKLLAWLVSVVGFSLIHVIGYIGYYSWDVLLVCALQYLPAGICLAGAYRYSGNILAPILMHSVSNALAMAAMSAM